MIKGTTESGFEFEIPKKNIDNYEVLEVLGELEENPFVIPKVVGMLFGKEQKNKLKDHVRDEDGVVSSEKMGEEIKYVFEKIAELKNS
uniref:Phage protein n=1 Tax=Siphoviridae sp. ctwrX9 TaxID=2825735 RepID=A0A8S5PV75_9CAUD|nr:MAG TPA: hypothetical protein [Siphoviridae sp. ctwrX9]